MSRLSDQSKRELITTQYFSDNYRQIIKERDKSFYDKNDTGIDNFEWVLNKYSGYEYFYLNQYLYNGKVRGFTEKELRSWAYCLHSSLQFRTSNVENGTIVYRGLSPDIHAPSDWKKGSRFYFPNFISASRDLNEAKKFAYGGGIILCITITNNGNNGNNNYCRDISDISQIKTEKEVLITAFCIYTLDKIEENTYYLTCLGY